MARLADIYPTSLALGTDLFAGGFAGACGLARALDLEYPAGLSLELHDLETRLILEGRRLA